MLAPALKGAATVNTANAAAAALSAILTLPGKRHAISKAIPPLGAIRTIPSKLPLQNTG